MSGIDSIGGATIDLAIVGGGPRGTYALDALSRRWTAEMPALRVRVYEPAPVPGAGNIYDPAQPPWLRMNYGAGLIDAYDRQMETGPEDWSLHRWAQLRGPVLNHIETVDRDHYIPRAVVGEYLHHCHLAAVERLAKVADVELIPAGVDEIHRVVDQGGPWVVVAGRQRDRFDHVLVATGHEGFRAAEELDSSDTKFIPTIFPVQRHLSAIAVPAGSVVAVRGMGLTWIDAALSLTEGRGGRFETTDRAFDGGTDRATDGGKVYHRCGNEPAAIVPQSRSGRPMLAKPTMATGLDAFDRWEEFAERLARLGTLHGDLDFERDVWPVVIEAADALFARMNDSTASVPRPMCRDKFERWCQLEMSPTRCLEIMQNSIDVSLGRRPLDPLHALAQAWKSLYPQIVALVGGGGLHDDSWPAFTTIAAEMERMAFGPPVENVQRIVALIDAGIVDLEHLTDDVPAAADVLIDARIAPATRPRPGGLVDQMIGDHILACDPVSGGVMVDDAGHPIGSRGEIEQTLSLVGRATEGWVIGNDSLSRRLHDHVGHWAADLVSQCQSATPAEAFA